MLESSAIPFKHLPLGGTVDIPLSGNDVLAGAWQLIGAAVIDFKPGRVASHYAFRGNVVTIETKITRLGKAWTAFGKTCHIVEGDEFVFSIGLVPVTDFQPGDMVIIIVAVFPNDVTVFCVDSQRLAFFLR